MEKADFIMIGLIAIMVLLMFSSFSLASINGDSMEPTMSENDVVVVHPYTTISEGDIIVFTPPDRSDNIVHRVVEDTNSGFITQGDNNDVTDQNDGIPIVTEENVEGKVFTVSGTVIRLPISEQINYLANYRNHIILVLVVILMLDFIREQGKSVSFRRITNQYLLLRVFLLVFLITAIAIAIPAQGSTNFIVTETGEGHSIKKGTIETSTIHITDDVTIPGQSEYVTLDGGNIISYSINSEGNIIVQHGPYEEIGSKSINVNKHSYISVFSEETTGKLFDIHPLVPPIVISTAIILPIFLLSLLLIDYDKPIKRSKLKLIAKRWLR